MNPLSYGGTPVNIFFCICSISSSHLISLLLSLSRPVWLDIGIKIAQMFPKAVPKANHIIIIFLTWFFQIAQKSRNILAAFERKFVIQNFWKIAQSGRTAQDQSLSLSPSLSISLSISLRSHLINFVSIHFWTLVVSELTNIDLTRKMQMAE